MGDRIAKMQRACLGQRASASVLAVPRALGLECPCSAGRPRISTPLNAIKSVHPVMRTYCSTFVQRVMGTPVYMVLRMREAVGAREIPETQKAEAHQVFLDFCSGPWNINSLSFSVRINSNVIG